MSTRSGFIHSTVRLRWLGLRLSMLIPLLIIEMHFYLDIPWTSGLLYAPILPILGLIILLAQGSFLFHWASLFLFLIWGFLQAILIYDTLTPAYAFFFLFGATLWIHVMVSVFLQFREPYIHPEMEWYQDLPQVLPRLRAKVQIKGSEYFLRVGGLNMRGIYLFFEGSSQDRIQLQNLWRSDQSSKTLMFSLMKGSEALGLSGRLIRFMEQGRGLGIEFTWMNADSRKLFLDFFYKLRSEGYVQ